MQVEYLIRKGLGWQIFGDVCLGEEKIWFCEIIDLPWENNIK